MTVGAFSFFLGGRDLEMAEIGKLLEETGQSFVDRQLAWGAVLSSYAPEIEHVVRHGLRPVAIELGDDMPAAWPRRQTLVVVDHHGTRAGAGLPTSLEQVARLIGAPGAVETRWRQLVIANDRGHIAGLKAIGATLAEIQAIRAADRRAQGVTLEHERAAKRAIDSRRICGRLTIVEADVPSATSVSDFIVPEFGGPGADRLLVIMPGKLAASGDGAVISALACAVPSSWWGGALPLSGFWGAERPADLPTILDILQNTA